MNCLLSIIATTCNYNVNSEYTRNVDPYKGSVDRIASKVHIIIAQGFDQQKKTKRPYVTKQAAYGWQSLFGPLNHG